MRPSLRGRLLVATPELADPNFRRTVVLALAHGDEGTLGIVLNRPSRTEVEELVPAWAPAAAEPPFVFIGGPVNLDGVVGLARVAGSAPDGEGAVVGDLHTVDLNRDPTDLARPLLGARLFAGSAGWGPRQLEGELEAGAWFVVDALPADALSPEPERLWERVLRRQPGRLAWFANAAGEPEHN